MPFRATFQCLWCGRPHQTRGPTDLEGWAQLCPDCLGRAGENAFLRFLLKRALAERAESGASTRRDGSPVGARAASAGPSAATHHAASPGPSDASHQPVDEGPPSTAARRYTPPDVSPA